MNANSLADALAGVAGVATMMLNGKALPAIGNGMRMNLTLPVVLGDGESTEHCEVGIASAIAAAIGELLRVDLHLVESDATGSHGYVCRHAP